MQFNSSSTGGTIESLSDADDQAKKAKSQEAPRGASQASEEAEEAKREKGPCGRSEKSIPLAVFQGELGNPMRPPFAPVPFFLSFDPKSKLTHYPMSGETFLVDLVLPALVRGHKNEAFSGAAVLPLAGVARSLTVT